MYENMWIFSKHYYFNVHYMSEEIIFNKSYNIIIKYPTSSIVYIVTVLFITKI